MLAIIAFALSWRMRFDAKEQSLKTINDLMKVMLGIGFFFVLVSLLDNIVFDLSGGFLLKAYPFRMQAMAFLIFIMIVIYFWKKKILSSLRMQNTFGVALALTVALMLFKGYQNIDKMLNYQNDTAYNEVIDYFNANTEIGATAMFLQDRAAVPESGRHNNKYGLDFMRRTRRDNFVHFKLVPCTPGGLYEWYQRIRLVEAVEQDPANANALTVGYTIDHYVAPSTVQMNLPVVFENQSFKVYSSHPIIQK